MERISGTYSLDGDDVSTIGDSLHRVVATAYGFSVPDNRTGTALAETIATELDTGKTELFA